MVPGPDSPGESGQPGPPVVKRTCDTCLCRYQGACAHDALVGTGRDLLEGSPQTKLGEVILSWLGDNLSTARGDVFVRRNAPPCPGWRRR